MRLRWLSVVAGLGLGLSSCSFDDGGVQPDGNGTPPDASVDAVPPVCTPGCEGDILVTCPEGVAQRAECDLGCVADATPHCAVMVPSNGVSVGDLDVVPVDKPFVVPDGETYIIDTDTGRIEDAGGDVVRPATAGGGVHTDTGTYYARIGDPIGLFAVDALIVEAGGVLRGEGGRALVILSRRDILVRGTIDFSAGCLSGVGGSTCGGPGGGDGSSLGGMAGGCARGGNGVGLPGGGDPGDETGGGGGSLGGAGGAGGGGRGPQPRPGGAGGQLPGTCPGVTLQPLAGGSGGGGAGIGDANGGAGGGGGGAIQLSSLTRIEINAGNGADSPASIRVNGAGGTATVTSNQGGGGGGSGGALLLEAPELAVAGGSILVANGGGGGSGTVPGTTAGANGQAGGLTATRAAGGVGDDDGEGFGGVGGARSGGAMPGGGNVDGGGGGGGGVGIIRVNRRTQTIGGDAVISPQQSEGALSVQ
jgi:hypothetical protein